MSCTCTSSLADVSMYMAPISFAYTCRAVVVVVVVVVMVVVVVVVVVSLAQSATCRDPTRWE
jgi:hypothetical protein